MEIVVSKTPEEMAEEYIRYENESAYWTKHAFLAGYKAAQDQFRSTTGGAGDKLTPTGWISVKDRLEYQFTAEETPIFRPSKESK
jgi:hypothetical protein